ncbi:YihY/virulence factor BrkB family protein [Halogeometricum sp. S1BR25-6]|uniref:YihY/virulence factor BrkB family protein n=1 Tax=Halogeometricum salsisoli TaxID=2950536 RepID=A0ABU2GEK6_9EURY|nr:YihY/virulence factor BrkB family protein [Halogeometricum sp. S1BR25-6]MDS0298744.1 YihY/virulence factor BrkB family protein [Halogeometricum sp. S1BR25-6]
MSRADSVVRVTKAVVAISREKNVTTLAASLSYYVFNAFVPTVFLLVVGIATFGSVDAIAQGLGRLTSVEPNQLQRVLKMIGAQTDARVRALSLAVAIMVWSTLKSFRSIQDTFAEVYGTRRHTSFWGRIRDTGLVFVGTTIALIVVSFVSVALSLALGGWWSVASGLLIFASLVVGFFPMYYFFPGVDQSPREALPGVLVAAAAWTVSGFVFRVYVGLSESVQLYGIAGVALIFLSWLYLGGLAILVGVVVNAVLSGRVDADLEWLPSVPSAPEALSDDDEVDAEARS